MKTTHALQLGLRENWKQFSLLVIINALVGSLLGLERSIFPELAFTEFHISETGVVLSFIIVFGISKAVTNLFTGYLISRFGRKKMLVLGWLFAVPVPFIFIFAEQWSYIVLANVLLGVNQGMAWSTAVVMKMDLVGEKQRGLAMGLNEFAGYFAIAFMALITSYITHHWGVHPYPFYIGFFIVFCGLLLSTIFLNDTEAHSAQEIEITQNSRLTHVFWDTTWRHGTLSAITQAGLINNLIDGVVWGAFPIVLYAKGFNSIQIGSIVATYPMIWGVAQLFTGYLGDYWSKKKLIVAGMLLQGLALLMTVKSNSMNDFLVVSTLLGIGTALVYPTFLAAIAEQTHPLDRAKSLGVYRFWRDLGYAIGALLIGFLAMYFNISFAFVFIALLAVSAAVVVFMRMTDFINE